MATVEIKDAKGAAAGTAELNASVFGIEPNVPVMHLVVRAQRASWRQGTHATRTRGMVRGGGKKPWRQKGTGRARQGTIRAPHWVGGGVVFGPTPRNHSIRVNNKEVKLAMRSALSAKLNDGELVVVKDFDFEAPSTKEAKAVLAALGLENKRVTIMIPSDDINTYLSFRNIYDVTMVPVNEVNTYEILDNKTLVLTESAVKYIEEVLA